MRHDVRGWLAGFVCCAGVLVAGRSLWHNLYEKRRAPTFVAPVNEVLAARLAPSVLDTTPTAATVEAVLAEAARRVTETLPRGAQVAAPEDLSTVFGEQLRAIIAGDFKAHVAAWKARGTDWPSTPEAEEYWTRVAEPSRNARLGLSALQTRVIYDRGIRVTPEPRDGSMHGEDHLTIGKPLFGGSPEDEKLTIVEVQLPIELPAHDDGNKHVTLVGFRFAWHTQRKQWVVWSLVQTREQGPGFDGLAM